MKTLIAALTLGIASGAAAQSAPQRILFVGNSFIQGAHSAVRNWHANRVTDVMGAGYGGVPALFREFAEQKGLKFDVSLETQGGKTLAFHLAERRAQIDQAWDVVVLQEHSMLDPKKPGDPAGYISATREIAALLRKRNPKVRIFLMSTWSRADQIYPKGGAWSGKPIDTMALDLRRAADQAMRDVPGLAGVIPVGEGWNRAMACNVGDPNPYDGIAFDRVDLWAYDHYHASVAGYYLEALIAFGVLTGADPASLGAAEPSGDQLGLSDRQVMQLQKIAHDQLAGKPAGSC